MQIEHINPADVYDSLETRGYTQVVAVTGMSRFITVSGQLPLDIDNKLIGQGDIEAQARACYENLRRSLRAAGADLEHVIRMTTYITSLADHPRAVRKVRAEYFGKRTPPASVMIEVPRLLNNMLIEIEAIAML